MRRIVGLVLVVVAVLFSMVAGISAQDVTPPSGSMEPPESFELAPGVMVDLMVFGPGAESPINYRLHFEPGVTYAVEPSGALELIYVESGELTVTLDGVVVVDELGDARTVGEGIEANLETTITAGQYFVLQPGVGGEVRNDGEETAIVSVAGILPPRMVTTTATPEN
jgi:quercetin dioxygenase-like cupin family protein